MLSRGCTEINSVVKETSVQGMTVPWSSQGRSGKDVFLNDVTVNL